MTLRAAPRCRDECVTRMGRLPTSADGGEKGSNQDMETPKAEEQLKAIDLALSGKADHIQRGSKEWTPQLDAVRALVRFGWKRAEGSDPVESNGAGERATVQQAPVPDTTVRVLISGASLSKPEGIRELLSTLCKICGDRCGEFRSAFLRFELLSVHSLASSQIRAGVYASDQERASVAAILAATDILKRHLPADSRWFTWPEEHSASTTPPTL